MSYDQLMQHATEIEQSAADAEYRQLARLSPRYPPVVSYEELQQKYQGRAQPLFEPFTRIPDPASYDGLITDLRDAMGYLSYGSHVTDPISGEVINANRDLRAIETASDLLTDWTGEAAGMFKANFLDPFPTMATNQFVILSVQKGAVEADRAAWQHARKDIDDIAHRTIDALDNLGSCGQNDIEFALSVAAAVVAVAAIPLSAGASATALAAVGAAVTTAGAVKKGVETITGGGGSPDQILNSMQTAIDKLTGQIQDTQGKISHALTGFAGEVTQGSKPPSPYVSARPNLATMDTSALTSSQGLGHTV